MIIISYNRRIKVIRKQGDFKPIFALFYFRLITIPFWNETRLN
nr:MAG TPA: hypothetical protein [Caudoviricetes sp.]